MKQKFTTAAATVLLVCHLTQVKDPRSGKFGWLEACGESTKPAHYLGHFDKNKKQAMKRAKSYFKSFRPAPKFTVSVDELRSQR